MVNHNAVHEIAVNKAMNITGIIITIHTINGIIGNISPIAIISRSTGARGSLPFGLAG